MDWIAFESSLLASPVTSGGCEGFSLRGARALAYMTTIAGAAFKGNEEILI